MGKNSRKRERESESEWERDGAKREGEKRGETFAFCNVLMLSIKFASCFLVSLNSYEWH